MPDDLSKYGAVSAPAADLSKYGTTQQQTPAPQPGFFRSIYDSTIGGIVDNIKDYFENGPPAKQGLQAAGRLMQLYHVQDTRDLTPAEESEMTQLEGKLQPASVETPLAQGISAPAVHAGMQAREGNYSGAAGTLTGSYALPAAAAAIAPHVVPAVKAATNAIVEQVQRPGTTQLATGVTQGASAAGAAVTGHPFVAGGLALRAAENIKKGLAARGADPLLDGLAQGAGYKDFASAPAQVQATFRTQAARIGGQAPEPGTMAHPGPVDTGEVIPPGTSLSQQVDQYIAQRNGQSDVQLAPVVPQAPASPSLRTPVRPPLAFPPSIQEPITQAVVPPAPGGVDVPLRPPLAQPTPQASAAPTPNPVEYIPLKAADGRVTVVAATKDSTTGFRDFGDMQTPAVPGKEGNYNLRPDKIAAMSGVPGWEAELADRGLVPENVVGAVGFEPGNPKGANPNMMYPMKAYVDPDFQRQGIATGMYDTAQQHFEPGSVLGSGAQSPEGQAFRESYDAAHPASTSAAAPAEPAKYTANRTAVVDRLAQYLHNKGVQSSDLDLIGTNKAASDHFWDNAGSQPGISEQSHYSPSEATRGAVREALKGLEDSKAPATPQAPANSSAVLNTPEKMAAARAVEAALHGPSTMGDLMQNVSGANGSTGVKLGQDVTRTTAAGETAEAIPPAKTNQGSSGPGAGAQTQVPVPGEGSSYPAQYRIVELSDVQPSHNGLTFQPNPEYSLTNDRDYTRAENQGKVIEGALPNKFNSSYLITDNPDASNGPPLIDSQGNAIGGNGRSMILQRVYASNPAGADAYKAMLAQKASQFGIDPADLKQFKQPVLVRQISDDDLLSPQNAVTDFNKTGTAALRGAERAIADSRRVSSDTLESIGGRLEAAGPDATLTDILTGKGGVEVFNKLVSDGVIGPQERAAYLDSGTLTKDGQARISKLLLGRFFRDPAQLDSIPVSIKTKLERIVAPLAKVESSPEWSLSGPVQEAMDLLEDANAHGAKNLGDLLGQEGLFGTAQYSPEAVTLAQTFRTAKINDLIKAARQYAQDAEYTKGGGGLFGDAPTPAESFEDAFGSAKGKPTKPASQLTIGDLMQ